MVNEYRRNLGKILKQQRLMIPLTLQELAAASQVSPSHLGRIERGERFPSAQILQRIARPMGFEENELFTLAGYLSPQPPMMTEKEPEYSKGLDPYVAMVLGQEPVEVQQAVIGLLTILKNISTSMLKAKTEENSQ